MVHKFLGTEHFNEGPPNVPIIIVQRLRGTTLRLQTVKLTHG